MDDYPNATACFACHYSCKTCQTDNAYNNCLSCDLAANRIYNDSTNVCQCNSGYFDDGSSTICGKCHYSCNTCSNPGSGIHYFLFIN